MQRLAKPRPRALDKKDALRAKAINWRTVSRDVKRRDRGKCRLCGQVGSDVHHVEFRSRGGADTIDNLVLLCRADHDAVHQHVVKLAGSATALKIGRWSDAAEDFVWGTK
jgi:5-methylcytosine-specific restriction endonuclease McrA